MKINIICTAREVYYYKNELYFLMQYPNDLYMERPQIIKAKELENI